MSEISIREQVTAMICEVIHPQPSTDSDRAHCHTAGEAAEVVLAELARRIRAGAAKSPRPPESEGSYEYWRGYRALAAELALCFEPDLPAEQQT